MVYDPVRAGLTVGFQHGDGFVEYERLTDRGLINQGWKDSWDGINFADGTIAELPIALCEVQAHAYPAYMIRSKMASDAGDLALAAEFRERGEQLKKQFNEQFWLPDRGYYAIALDGQKRPVDACASNMGQCLVFGIIDEDKAPLVAERLMSPEMFSGWGVPTLATTPLMLIKSLMAYHPDVALGSLWMDHALPQSYGDLHITNAPMAGSRITIDIVNSVPSVQGLPEGMVFHHGARPWMTELALLRSRSPS